MNSVFYCLIPAKGISKSIPKKNLLKIQGKSLLEISISSAKKCSLIKETFVSSENLKILKIAKRLKAIDLKRSKRYSKGNIEPKYLVKEFLKKTKHIKNKDYIVYLQPTSPLRTSFHIKSAIEKIIKEKTNSLTSVVKVNNKILKSIILKNNKIYSIFKETNLTSSRQKLKEIYLPNGAIYIFKVSEFLKKNNFPINGSTSFIMSRNDSVDIDTLEDLRVVKDILKI